MGQVKAGVAVSRRNCLLGLQSTDSSLQYLLGSSDVENVDSHSGQVGWSVVPQTERSGVQFPVGAHT